MKLPRLSFRIGPVLGVVMALLLVTGVSLVAYARWMRPAEEAEQALTDGQLDRALERYGVAEGRFKKVQPVRTLLNNDYQAIIANQLWALYSMKRYDDVVEKAAASPEGAAAHFWSGSALFQKAVLEEKADARAAWLARSEEEFRKALELAPDDWDAKYNYELVKRLEAEMKKKPKNESPQPNLLRPQPKQQQKPVPRVG
jgi:Flp pilus assembly protein TadD